LIYKITSSPHPVINLSCGDEKQRGFAKRDVLGINKTIKVTLLMSDWLMGDEVSIGTVRVCFRNEEEFLPDTE
jgi:hydrogenase maturation factor